MHAFLGQSDNTECILCYMLIYAAYLYYTYIGCALRSINFL